MLTNDRYRDKKKYKGLIKERHLDPELRNLLAKFVQSGEIKFTDFSKELQDIITNALSNGGGSGASTGSLTLIQQAISDLQTNKMDKTDMGPYFDVNIDKVTESMLDNSLKTKINSLISSEGGSGSNITLDQLSPELQTVLDNLILFHGKTQNIDLEELQTQSQNNAENILSLTNKTNTIQSNFSTLNADYSAYKLNVDAISMNVSNLSDDLTSLSNKIDTINTSIESLNSSLSELEEIRNHLNELDSIAREAYDRTTDLGPRMRNVEYFTYAPIIPTSDTGGNIWIEDSSTENTQQGDNSGENEEQGNENIGGE